MYNNSIAGRLKTYNSFDTILSRVKNLESRLAEIQESVYRYEKSIQNLDFGILIENSERKIEIVNQKFCDIFDIPQKPQMLYGMDCSQMAGAFRTYFKEPDKFIERLDKILENGLKCDWEIIEKSDGKILQRSYLPIKNGEVLTGHLWVYSDITEKYKAEEKLDKQKIFYETILNSIPSDIAVFDSDHRYLFVNPLGIKDPEIRKWIIGKQDEDYCHLKNKPMVIAEERRKVFNKVLNERKQFEWEEKLENQGSTEYLLRRMTPILNNENELSYIIGYGLNITERKKIEEEIIKAKREAEASSEAKEVFLANISHEIRTPMNGIIGLTAVLQRTNLDTEQAEYMKLIQNSASDLLQLINDILDFEKINRNKLTLEKIDFQPAENIKRIVDVFNFTAKEKGIKLKFLNKLPDNLSVKGDPVRFSQIVTNLISNAVKFTEKGYVSISSSIRKTAFGRCIITLKIKDTGIGIRKEKLGKLFKPFIQEEAEISRKFGGSGLGLAIVNDLVKLHNGSIKVLSKKNSGSTFTIHLQYDFFIIPETKPNKKKVIEYFNDLSNITILLAEDNEVNQVLAKSIVNRWGAKLIIAENGLEAVSAVNNNDIDLVFMDIQMPVLNGIEAAKKIRRLSEQGRSDVPIIAVTANAIKGTEKKYFEAGMNGYITKPYTEDELYSAAIKYALRNKTVKAQTEKSSKVKNPQKKDLLYDLVHINQIAQGDKQIIDEIIDLFKSNTPQYLKELNNSFASNNIKAVNQMAHKLKSTVFTFRINSVLEELNRLEYYQDDYSHEMMKTDIDKVNSVLNNVMNNI